MFLIDRGNLAVTSAALFGRPGTRATIDDGLSVPLMLSTRLRQLIHEDDTKST